MVTFPTIVKVFLSSSVALKNMIKPGVSYTWRRWMGDNVEHCFHLTLLRENICHESLVMYLKLQHFKQLVLAPAWALFFALFLCTEGAGHCSAITRFINVTWTLVRVDKTSASYHCTWNAVLSHLVPKARVSWVRSR